MVTLADLVDDGCVVNPHCWSGDGWIYCPGCETYRRHTVYSHPGLRDCFEVCQVCEQYHGTETLKGVVRA